MADRLFAVIEIGGDVPSNLIQELAETIATEDVYSAENEAKMDDPEVVRQYLLDCAQERTNPEFYNDQVAWGEFDILEDWLEEHGVDFDRTTAPSGEYNGETYAYRHETDEEFHYVHDKDRNPIIKYSRLTQWVEWLKDGQIDLVIDEIKEHIEPFPPLKSFRIVEAHKEESDENRD